MDEPLSFEKVTIDEAKKVLDGTLSEAPKQEEADWRWARTFSPSAKLNDNTLRWIADLPEKARPNELAALYPRIANKLCELWTSRDKAERFFEELQSDKRTVGNRRDLRKGFPGNIGQEIAALRKHLFNPEETTTLWEKNANVYWRR